MEKLRYSVLLFFIAICVTIALSVREAKDDVHGHFPNLEFIENQGQWPSPYKFEVKLGSSKLFIQKDGLTFNLIDPSTIPIHGHGLEATKKHSRRDDGEKVLRGHAFKINFLGSNTDVKIKGKDKIDTYHNYFLGSDTSRWKGYVPLYRGVQYNDIYDGIDLEVYQAGSLLKYDYIVTPGSDPSNIKMRYDGVTEMSIDQKDLIIKTSVEEIIEKEPYAYQILDGKPKAVKCKFQLDNNIVSFKFPDGYNEEFELIIDPVLVFSSFTGSAGDNFGVTAAFDSDGNGYAAGMQFGPGFPITVGAYETTFNNGNFPIGGGPDIIDLSITKFRPDGTGLLYATYLGGSFLDIPHSLIVNEQDQLVIFGTTTSEDFPTTAGAYDRTFNGGVPEIGLFGSVRYVNGSDIFISILSEGGNNLLSSTYLGGEDNDGVNNAFDLVGNYADEFRGEVNIDNDGNIIVATTTVSRNFPVTANAHRTIHAGGLYDAVVAKLNPSLTNLLWASYYGGSGDDVAYSMKVDQNNNIYFTGGTTSDNITTTAGAVNPSFGGGVSDGYLAQFSADGSSLNAATYLGTDNVDQSYFVELDPDGDIYALGVSRGGNYPVQGDVYSVPGSVQFLHKMTPDLSTTLLSTVWGNGTINGRLALNAFMIDDCYRIYMSGWGGVVNDQATSVHNFPLTFDAFQSSTDGSDFYFLVFEPNARELEYATYFGGSTTAEHVDGGTSRFDRRGIVYQAVCAGCGGSDDFPTSANAFSRVNGSNNCNLALIKFDFQLDQIRVNAIASPDLTGCAPYTVNFRNLSQGPIDIYDWDFGDGTTTDEESPEHTFDAGSYTVRLIGLSEFDCVEPDTVEINIDVVEPEEKNYSQLLKCQEDAIELSSSFSDAGTTYLWRDGSETQHISATEPGIYWVHSFTNAGCFLDSFLVENLPVPSSSQDVGGCEPENYVLRPQTFDPAFTYLWQDGTTDSTFRATDDGIYYVITQNPFDCDRIDSFIIDEYPLKDPVINEFDLCPGKSTTISPNINRDDATYTWQNGTQGSEIEIDHAGTYWVITEFPNECPQTDSFYVRADTLNPPTLDSFRICEETFIELSSKEIRPGATFTWSTGDSSGSIRVENTGTYDVLTDFDRVCPFINRYYVRSFPVIDENDIYFPNAFSPNDDGINDTFRPFFSNLVTVLDYEFHVYNRWGQKVFETTIPQAGWDGFDLKQPEAVAVYVWWSRVNLISCTGDPLDVYMEGDVTLMK